MWIYIIYRVDWREGRRRQWRWEVGKVERGGKWEIEERKETEGGWIGKKAKVEIEVLNPISPDMYLNQNNLHHLHIVWYAALSDTHKLMQLACRSNSSPFHHTSHQHCI